MKTAANLVKDIDDLWEQFDVIADLDAKDIVAAIEAKLESLGKEGIMVEVVIDDGIFVLLEDEENDDVLVWFGYDESNSPVAEVVSDGDEQITIDLSLLNPGVIEMEGMGLFFVDLVDLSWMNKSTLNTLLAAGDVTSIKKPVKAIPAKLDSDDQKDDAEDDEKDDAEDDEKDESVHAVMGRNKMKLPVVKVNAKNDRTSKLAERARALGMYL